MSYVTRIGTVPALVAAVSTVFTSDATLAFQSPNQKPCGCDAILLICAASLGRDDCQASTWCRALEFGSTYMAPDGFEDTGGVAEGDGVGVGVGLTVGVGVGVAVAPVENVTTS